MGLLLRDSLHEETTKFEKYINSQMLQAAANLAPRGVYVCGNTTTTAGLTVTLSKEGGSGDFALEAGALVLADQGLDPLFVCLFVYLLSISSSPSPSPPPPPLSLSLSL